ncbi:Cytochrome P450 B-class protein [Dioscorea alata]|uniref:Cytochrome P450 B-class protein n=1 Tax=Dioscorea alata TaxID=55571 RepID=A0ACB7W1V5_DIOAL|nr:Cytochrome P450 B-class protein [Dioscorea alata]
MAETLQLPLTSLFPTLPLLLLLLLLLLNLKKNHQKSSLKLPPGPRSLSIIGNCWGLRGFPDLFYGCTDITFSPYGPYWRQIRKLSMVELLSAKRVESYSIFRSSEEIEHTFKRFDALFDEIIKDHLERREQMIRGSSNDDDDDDDDEQHDKEKMDAKDLVDVLLDVQNGTGLEIPLTMDNIKAVILGMFAGGTDTIFITLDWGMTELIINPRVMKKAQEEVRNRVGNRKFVLESDLPHLLYLKAVIKEIFRFHPPAPLLVPRESMEQVTIEGYQIPAKTRVFINAWAIGRDIESWENPEVFEPERFMNSSVDFKGQDFELIPFGAGRRGCPAITFGAVTIEIALAQLLHGFNWELPPGIAVEGLDMKEVFGITMHRIQELVVVAKPHFM